MLHPELIRCLDANGNMQVIRNPIAMFANDVAYERELGQSEPARRLEAMGTAVQARLLRNKYIRENIRND